MASSALPFPGPDDGAAGSGAGAGTEDSASGSGLSEGAGVAGGAGEEAPAVGDVEASPVGVPPPSFGVQAGNSKAANNNAAIRRYGLLLDCIGLDCFGRGRPIKCINCTGTSECTLGPPRGLSVMMPFYCRSPAGRLGLLGLGSGCDESRHGRVQVADLVSGQTEAFHHGAWNLERLLPKGRACRSEADGEGALVAVHPPS
jgi:hypothetical protein